MPPDRSRCSECAGAMEPGYIPDFADSGILMQRWFPGTPKTHWRKGLKVDGNACRSVETDRCKNCGFLKSYANAMPGKPGWNG